MELRDIDSRRKIIQREEYSQFRRRQLRRTRRAKDEGLLGEGEEERESLESYEPSSASRGNDSLHRYLGATKPCNENEVRPTQGQPQSSEGEGSSPDEDDGYAGLEGYEQNRRARASTFTRRPNERLEDTRGQGEVIHTICCDTYRPTERSRLTTSESRTGDMPPGSPSLDVSQAQYVAPPRGGGLSVSATCCGSMDKDIDQDREEEPMGNSSGTRSRRQQWRRDSERGRRN